MGVFIIVLTLIVVGSLYMIDEYKKYKAQKRYYIKKRKINIEHNDSENLKFAEVGSQYYGLGKKEECERWIRAAECGGCIEKDGKQYGVILNTKDSC